MRDALFEQGFAAAADGWVSSVLNGTARRRGLPGTEDEKWLRVHAGMVLLCRKAAHWSPLWGCAATFVQGPIRYLM